MKKISAKIVADSVSPQGHRITSMLLTYPRMIHAEMCRHRMHSRNSASSRAIPFEKMVEKVENDPFIPLAWQGNHKGMQGEVYWTDESRIRDNENEWLRARDNAVSHARILNQAHDVTKQLCNRLLEPFLWHTELVTGTEWKNFFELRCPNYEFDDGVFRSKKDVAEYIGNIKEIYSNGNKIYFIDNIATEYHAINTSQAEIHIQALAEQMWDAYNSDYNSLPYERQKELVVEFHQNIIDNNIKGLYEYIEEHHPTNLNLSMVESDFTHGEGFKEWLIDQGYHASKELKESQWHIPFGDQFNEDKVKDISKKVVATPKELKIKVAVARAARLSYFTHDGEIDYKRIFSFMTGSWKETIHHHLSM